MTYNISDVYQKHSVHARRTIKSTYLMKEK